MMVWMSFYDIRPQKYEKSYKMGNAGGENSLLSMSARVRAHILREKIVTKITTFTTAVDFQHVAVVNMVADVVDSLFTTLVKRITRLVMKR